MNLLLFAAKSLPSTWRRKLSIWVFNRPGWSNRWLRSQVDRIAKDLRETDATIMDGEGKGLRFNVGKSRASYLLGTPKLELQKAMSRFLKPGMVVYDVGANVGYQACISSRMVGPSGSVYCFEPLAVNAAQIEYNANLNGFKNIHVRHEALGREDSQQTFLLSDESTWGALASATDTVPKQIGETTVEVRQLDALRQRESLPAPDWIKVDVEGAECFVLDGAEATLREFRPAMVIELHGTNLEIASRLKNLGYYYTSLDSPEPMETAIGNPNILAVPEEKAEMVALAKELFPSSVRADQEDCKVGTP